MDVILKMFFFSFNNVDIRFAEGEIITWRNHTIAIILPRPKKVKLIKKRKSAIASPNEKADTFVVYVAELPLMFIYQSRKALI